MGLTVPIGHQIRLLSPIANNSPPVLRFTTETVVESEVATSVLALRSEVLEKQAPSVVQLVTKTRMLFRHKGRLSYKAEALVSTFSRSFWEWDTVVMGVGVGISMGVLDFEKWVGGGDIGCV